MPYPSAIAIPASIVALLLSAPLSHAQTLPDPYATHALSRTETDILIILALLLAAAGLVLLARSYASEVKSAHRTLPMPSAASHSAV